MWIRFRQSVIADIAGTVFIRIFAESISNLKTLSGSMKRKIVFLTGAGVSAESGISTFRDADGLWEKYPVMQVCAASIWFRADPALVHRFYNERRRQLLEVSPNSASTKP